MARIYANENFPLPVVEELRRLGHNVVTTSDSGMAGKALPDQAVLALAAADNRILITPNRRHFIRMHALNPDHCGIVACSFDAAFAAQARRVHEALEAAGPLNGKVIRINRPA